MTGFCAFRAGQMVECVDDGWVRAGQDAPPIPLPVSGCVYTIADLKPFGGGVFLHLEPFGPEIWFLSAHFRPVRPTSIEPLRALLAPLGAREREIA
ncbi:hypothetical protein [Ancylobacter polymorphus]|uniref:Uncharacterized protein n=1 Tax=Ancylobacter polymorphus TaxID=223390 RepID=A0A9E7AB16_9HYPH|nr:hypothetical protein [Ancylobacter polymorphus]UOK72993.1 hypothetical protein K9D25_09985 [Ancylobacter polymorphus]